VVGLARQFNDLVEDIRDAQQALAISRRESVDQTAQPLHTVGVTSGHDRLSSCGERQLRDETVCTSRIYQPLI
jgi:hypothetical protein